MEKILIDLQKPSKDFSRKLVTTLYLFLLHTRSQIPFPFEIFRKFIKDKQKYNLEKIDEECQKRIDWKTSKQLRLAEDSLLKIEASMEFINSHFTPGLPLLIVFGNTIHTPKESYEIIFPHISENTIPTHTNESMTIKKILLNLIQNDMTSEREQLATTNVFLIFKRAQPMEDHSEFNFLNNFRLAKSCKKYSIQFRDSSDFQIFAENLQEMSLNEKEKPETDLEPEFWYQSRNFVKGFKDVLVNSKSIWS